MQKQTNMEQVKDVAKMFLHMGVGKTKFSPIVVKHPFADSGITMVRTETGNYEMVNLLKEEDLVIRTNGSIVDELRTRIRDNGV